jgi:hypothetical protein
VGPRRCRRRWRSWQAGLYPSCLIFIDETWIKTNMAPLRGWDPKGEWIRGFAPHGRWRTLTFLGALRCDRLTAPCLAGGPINGECFRAYVEQILLPSLHPGDINIQLVGMAATALTSTTAPVLSPARATMCWNCIRP